MSNTMYYFEAMPETDITRRLIEWQSGFPDMGVLALVAEADRAAAIPRLQDLCSQMNVPLYGAVFPALL